jgi:neutral ceramidase
MTKTLLAGASAVDITPQDSQFLYGYPHVERYSTGCHDPLFCSALFLSDGNESLLFLANDIIFISKQLSRNVRKRIRERTGIPNQNISITATHTHSGPITVNYISNKSDAIIPKADEKYLSYLENCLCDAAIHAFQNAQPAKIGQALADSTGIGTNRHDPAGAADFQVPVLMVKSLAQDKNIACLIVCSMHPTVLHEDSTQISGDFPGMARQYLQTEYLGKECPVLHHTGPAGNQSPRHVTSANTFSEAERLGRILAEAIIQAIPKIDYESNISLSCLQKEIDLPRKNFPSIKTAQENLDKAHKKLNRLRTQNAKKQQIRTAECDWFGAEETLTLAKAAAEGRLDATYQSCLPAEIQVFKIGPWTFIGWPGEIFVEYALQIKNKLENTFVISLSNGELQGYIVTHEAEAGGWYEASNALFSCESGQILVNETIKLIQQIK